MDDLLVRLDIAASTNFFSADLVCDLRTTLIQQMPDMRRRALQERLIRQASELLEGTPWQKATQLAALIRRWSGHAQNDPITKLLYQAVQTGRRLPCSARHIYRVLTDG